MRCSWPECWSQYHQNRLLEATCFNMDGITEGPSEVFANELCGMECDESLSHR